MLDAIIFLKTFLYDNTSLKKIVRLRVSAKIYQYGIKKKKITTQQFTQNTKKNEMKIEGINNNNNNTRVLYKLI